MASSAQPSKPTRIVFLTRDPVVHQQGGSTTYALGLLQLLRAHGAEVTLVATTAFSRSPRLFFKLATAPPEGITLRFPGYLFFAGYFVCPFNLKAWARMVSRIATRKSWLRPLQKGLERLFGAGLFTGAWDLNPPAAEETALAVHEVERAGATVVLTNYCFWGPLLSDERLSGLRTAILMHDLLSTRVARFQAAGLPLDCPAITQADEMDWLSRADTVLAAQEREAEVIRPQVQSIVLVTPVLLWPQALEEALMVPGRCLFVGSNILPNQTGLQFLLEAVWPRVRAEIPEATLAVAGTIGHALGSLLGDGNASTGLRSLGVEKLGVVPSLEQEYARASVCLVPLLLGTGIKIKLLEALGYGKAIVSTSTGIQGLEIWAPETVTVADEAETFAEAIVRLLRDHKLRREREGAALRLAGEHFGPTRALEAEFISALL
ncbi:MAG: glycosyltransferase [Janthinobacterium lividum]